MPKTWTRGRGSDAPKGRRTLPGLAAPLVLALGLAACSTPDWADPDEWFDTETAETEQVPAEELDEDAPYPSLASVPEAPPRPSPDEQRAALAQGLVADHASARYSGEGPDRRQHGRAGGQPAGADRRRPDGPDRPAGRSSRRGRLGAAPGGAGAAFVVLDRAGCARNQRAGRDPKRGSRSGGRWYPGRRALFRRGHERAQRRRPGPLGGGCHPAKPERRRSARHRPRKRGRPRWAASKARSTALGCLSIGPMRWPRPWSSSACRSSGCR